MKLFTVSLFLIFILTLWHSGCTCSDGWVQSDAQNNKCYMFVNQSKMWFNADLYCRNAYPGAYLTSICSAFENANINAIVVEALTAQNLRPIWIGLSDIETAGVFHWIDGNSCQYRNWQPGQPNANSSRQCMMVDSVGRWTTQNCGIDNYFVCEVWTTTTTTTTDPSRPCINDQMCHGIQGYPGTCKINQTSTDYCDCPGNLDSAGCGKVVCKPIVDGGVYVTEPGPIWSPGYNGYNGTYEAGFDCQWIIDAPQEGLTVNVTAHYFKTKDNDGILTILSNTGGLLTLSGDYRDYMDTLNTRLGNAVQGADKVYFTFRSTTPGAVCDYFDFGFAFVTSSVT